MRLLLAALAGCPKPGVPESPVGTAPIEGTVAEGPALVVLIVVDQLPVRLLETPKQYYTAGLARLTGPEAAVRTARFAHAITYTCPGHATISTGAAPSVSGIVSNDWRLPDDPATNVYCADAKFLRVGTLADRVVDAGGEVASVALKDRSAQMLGGTRAHLMSWYDSKAGAFSGPLATDVDVAGWFRPWDALHPEDYARWVGPDDSPLESDPGIGITFPHPPPTAKSFLYTPFAGEALVDAALVAVDRLSLGKDGPPDLLAMSFSQTDYIGHRFTAESWEAMDNQIRLDGMIGRLLEGIEARVGEGRITVLLTSDHGAFSAKGLRRFTEQDVRDAANGALAQAGFAGEVQFESPSIWLPVEVRRDPAARSRASAAVAAAVRAVPGVGDAFAWRDVAVEGPHADAIRLSLDEERSGDVYVMRAEDALYSYSDSPGQGTSHGTPFRDDTDVPFLAWGVGVNPGPGEVVDVRQVAPTAARLLGVPPPDAATGSAVGTMLR